jgi:hypothetical protein
VQAEGVDRIARLAAADPNAPALILEDRTISWGEFDSRIHLASRRLAGRDSVPAATSAKESRFAARKRYR